MYLFVYGSLMNDSPHPMAEFLRSHAEFLGEGSMAGEKLDLGEYFGAVFLENAKTQVPGHIFKLSEPEKVLEILDRYEGIGEEFPQPQEYVRVEKPVNFQGGIIFCWVYLLIK